ncbi:L-2-amino-thiazoline-4-carboxylic acid hydrolase [Azohydromonas sediminis]|uniref:L-2-amino-thiazoline-4-carboxylic acid hydrolase n=1 Tax=Azohydromonas sediminis TaxID=2259674 RepID=UPI000E64C469
MGRLRSCHHDGPFFQGCDANVNLERQQTIMEGVPCCTFRYRLQPPARRDA